MQKKIVFVIPTLGSGGAERVISTLSNEFIKQDYQVLIVLTYDDVVKYELSSKVQIVALNCKAFEDMRVPTKFFIRWNIIRKALIEISPDVVISFMSENNIDVCMALVGTKIPLIVSERNDPRIDPQSRFKRMLRQIAYVRPQNFVFQTADARDYFSTKIQNRSSIILNPLTDTLPERYIGEREKRIVSVCRLNEQKNLPMLIDAFSIFVKKYPKYVLEIYGEGVLEKKLTEYIEEKDLVGQVILCGYSSNVHEKIKKAALFVLSSNYEGLPNALIEAMALGLPCISTDCPCGGPKMLIENNENGILIPIGATELLADAMERIISDPIFSEEIASAAVQLRLKVNKDNIVRKWQEVFCKYLCNE